MNILDREKAALWLIGNCVAQFNTLKVTMTEAYLIFMNVTLFKEVIEHFMNLLWSQYVIVAFGRAGMVHPNKYNWEC